MSTDSPQSTKRPAAPAKTHDRGSGPLLAWILTAAVAAFVFVMFHWLGNTVEDVHSRSAFMWMVARWQDPISFGTDYSIGWAIPFVSAWVLWRNRDQLTAAPRQVDWRALAIIVLALLLHWLGARAQQTRVSLVSFVILLWSVPWFLCGREVAKLLVFPCAYLLFCVPYNFLDAATFPLRMFASQAAGVIMNGVGIPVNRTGTMLFSLEEGGFSFNVADPCSGLHSLLAMSAITAIYAYCTQQTLVRKWTLFLAAIPIAIASNVTRIVVVAVIAGWLGAEVAVHVYEDYSGYIVFIVAVLLMLACSNLIEAVTSKGESECAEQNLKPTSS